MNIHLAPGSVHVLRSSDWKALVGAGWRGAFGFRGGNYSASPHASVVVLPDDATVTDIVAAISALKVPPPLPPTA